MKDTEDIHGFLVNLKNDKWNDSTFFEFTERFQKVLNVIEAIDDGGITQTMIPMLETHVKNLKDIQSLAGSGS